MTNTIFYNGLHWENQRTAFNSFRKSDAHRPMVFAISWWTSVVLAYNSLMVAVMGCMRTVSYTHLDVYKRQDVGSVAGLITRLQKQIMESGKHHIPAIFHIETLTGVMVTAATSFPLSLIHI